MVKKINITIIIIIIAAIVVLIPLMKTSTNISVHQPITGTWDISQAVIDNGYEQYIVETEDFDYSDNSVFSLAQQIKTTTTSPKDAIKTTIKFVASNVKYSSAVTIAYCYDEKASTVLSSGKGDCVSMSRLVSALLRAQGIPTRTMGGCLSSSLRCKPLFAMVPSLEAQTVPMAEGDFKKRGFLHEWVEVWTPDNGWQLVESTSGQVFDTSCNTYLEFAYDSNRYNRCTINDNDFFEQCRGH